MSPAIIALLLIPVGFVAILFLSGFQIFDVLSPGQSEEVTVLLKDGDICIVEPSDQVPRQITNCLYEEGDQIIVTYKNEQPALESHRPA